LIFGGQGKAGTSFERQLVALIMGTLDFFVKCFIGGIFTMPELENHPTDH